MFTTFIDQTMRHEITNFLVYLTQKCQKTDMIHCNPIGLTLTLWSALWSALSISDTGQRRSRNLPEESLILQLAYYNRLPLVSNLQTPKSPTSRPKERLGVWRIETRLPRGLHDRPDLLPMQISSEITMPDHGIDFGSLADVAICPIRRRYDTLPCERVVNRDLPDQTGSDQIDSRRGYTFTQLVLRWLPIATYTDRQCVAHRWMNAVTWLLCKRLSELLV